jgi:hypothetical protein
MSRPGGAARAAVAAVLTAMLGVCPQPVSAPAQAAADDATPTDIEVFDPVITSTPGISRELDVFVDHTKAPDGRFTLASLKFQYVVLSWLHLGLEVPAVVADPEGPGSDAGIGDIVLSGQARLWVSPERRAQVDVGLTLGLPTGSSHVLAGSTVVQPFVTGGLKLGPVDLLGDLRYAWGVTGPLSDQELFQANAAVGYPIATGSPAVSAVIPFVELNLFTPVRGFDDARTQLLALPGFELLLPGNTSISIGVQLPLAGPRAIDYRVLLLAKWKF